MFCRNCGRKTDGNLTTCAFCGNELGFMKADTYKSIKDFEKNAEKIAKINDNILNDINIKAKNENESEKMATEEIEEKNREVSEVSKNDDEILKQVIAANKKEEDAESEEELNAKAAAAALPSASKMREIWNELKEENKNPKASNKTSEDENIDETGKEKIESEAEAKAENISEGKKESDDLNDFSEKNSSNDELYDFNKDHPEEAKKIRSHVSKKSYIKFAVIAGLVVLGVAGVVTGAVISSQTSNKNKINTGNLESNSETETSQSETTQSETTQITSKTTETQTTKEQTSENPTENETIETNSKSLDEGYEIAENTEISQNIENNKGTDSAGGASVSPTGNDGSGNDTGGSDSGSGRSSSGGTGYSGGETGGGTSSGNNPSGSGQLIKDLSIGSYFDVGEALTNYKYGKSNPGFHEIISEIMNRYSNYAGGASSYTKTSIVDVKGLKDGKISYLKNKSRQSMDFLYSDSDTFQIEFNDGSYKNTLPNYFTNIKINGDTYSFKSTPETGFYFTKYGVDVDDQIPYCAYLEPAILENGKRSNKDAVMIIFDGKNYKLYYVTDGLTAHEIKYLRNKGSHNFNKAAYEEETTKENDE